MKILSKSSEMYQVRDILLGSAEVTAPSAEMQ